jgi:hypothetical protein
MSGSYSASSVTKPNHQHLIDLYIAEFELKSNGFMLPKIDYEFAISRNEKASLPVFFLAIPIKNQENIIREVLLNLASRLSFTFEVGLLFDNCDDFSFQVAMATALEIMEETNTLTQVHFVKSTDELFESTCENILFRLSDATYFVSFQADTMIEDTSFFERCHSAFIKNPNLLGISGRATVTFMPSRLVKSRVFSLLFPMNILTKLLPKFFKHLRLGPFLKGKDYFGDTSGFPFPRMKFTPSELNTLFVGQAVIRGPIVWAAEKFKKLGGFNDVAYFLGRDDCDISLRGLEYGFVVGYLPCKQLSNPNHGTTRKPRSKEVEMRLEERKILSSQHHGTLDSYWRSNSRHRKKTLANSKVGRFRIN